MLASETRAAALFAQSPDPGIHAGISSPLDYYGKSPGRRTADDFVLPAEASINEVVWWGQHAPPSSGADRYVVTFYSDANGLPGRILHEGSGRVVSRPHPSIAELDEYRTVLCDSFRARPGVRYWISIFNEGSGVAWRWNNSPSGNGLAVQSQGLSTNAWAKIPGSKTDLSFQVGTAPVSISDWARCNVVKIAIGAILLLALPVFVGMRARSAT